MNSVATIIVLLASVLGGMYFKNHVPRFASWNLFVLIGLSFVGAILALMLAVFFVALTR